MVTDQRYGFQRVPIYLDGLKCGKHASSLKDCWHNEIGVTDCTNDQDVGLICLTDTGTQQAMNQCWVNVWPAS